MSILLKLSFLFFTFLIFLGCADTGYVPSYIISHTAGDEVEDTKQPTKQEEVR